jgi:hypothetical protein
MSVGALVDQGILNGDASMKNQTNMAARSICFGFVLTIGSLSSAVFLGGCEDDEIHAYRVPRAAANVQQVNTPAPSLVGSGANGVSWTMPPAWHETETTSIGRIATFHAIDEIEVRVAAFPGDVGGMLANVNRWRGQVGLDETDEQGIAQHIEQVEDSTVIVVDITGTNDRLIGSVIDVGDGQTWFVKVVGDAATLDQIKPDLIAFSVSFHVHEQEAHDRIQPAAGGGEEDHTGHNHGDAAEPSEPGGKFNGWQPPNGWMNDPDASSMLTAAFFTSNGARVTLTALAGQGGGLIANVNRWRGQLGLDPVASMDDQPTEKLGENALVVDMLSQDGANRIMVGVVPMGEQSLYFKLTGSNEQVQAELENFDAFLRQVGLAEGGTP